MNILKSKFLAVMVLAASIFTSGCFTYWRDILVAEGTVLGDDGVTPIDGLRLEYDWIVTFDDGTTVGERFTGFSDGQPFVTDNNGYFTFQSGDLVLRSGSTVLECYDTCVAYDEYGYCIASVQDCYAGNPQMDIADIVRAYSGITYRIGDRFRTSYSDWDTYSDTGYADREHWVQSDVYYTPFLEVAADKRAPSKKPRSFEPTRRLEYSDWKGDKSLLSAEQWQAVERARKKMGIVADATPNSSISN